MVPLLLAGDDREQTGCVPDYLVEIGRLGDTYDCCRAVTELGVLQTPIDEAIQRSADWLHSNGDLSSAG